jgi:hypothetical protein
MSCIQLAAIPAGSSQYILAIATSLALDMLVSGVLVYRGLWDAQLALEVLACITTFGAVLNIMLVVHDRRSTKRAQYPF